MVRQWIANPRSPVRIWVPPYKFRTIILFLNLYISILYISSNSISCLRFSIRWECGEIGRHDGLKIHCLVISVRVQVPPFPS